MHRGHPRFHDSDPRDNSRFPESHPIYQFLSVSNDPWIPAGVIQPQDTLNFPPRSSAFNSGVRSFHDYRSTGLPSDCGTAPEDSGYGGTRSTYSFVDSVAENDGCAETVFLETRTTEQLIGDLNINPPALPIYQQPQMSHHQPPPVEFLCDQCQASCKTKSELKKHSARHLKPYKCTYESCPKSKQGFSTPNDLARHKKTVHREHNDNDPIYICHHGPCSRKKEKLWPRADNFRSHLQRSHNISLKADSDLRGYRYKTDAVKPQEFRGERRSTTSANAGRRSMQLQGASHVYTCRHNPCSQAKGKTWPKVDEFRAHLSNTHNVQPDDDLMKYYLQPETAEVHALRGVGSSIADVDPGPRPAQLQDSPDLRGDQASITASGQVHNESSKQSILPLTLACLTSGDKPQPIRSNILDDLKIPPAPGSEPLNSHAIVDLTCADEASLGEPGTISPGSEVTQESFDHEGDNIMGDDEEILDHQEPSTPQVASPNASIRPKADSPQNDISEALNTIEEPSSTYGASTETSAATPTWDPRFPSELLPILRNAPPGDILSLLKHIPKNLLEKALKPEDHVGSGNEHSSDQGEHQKAETCGECGKAFSRKCELRKHMKRHDKPYGCTYKTCGKMFGSKNDWKRHESSQHFQLESWNCSMKGCDKVLPRRELFKMHLTKHHKLQDSQQIETLQETCRLGRHCDPRFWCGFCDKFVDIEGEVVNSWTKRCDHIDSHLFGKEDLEKKTMNEWRYLEDKLAESEPEGRLGASSSNPPNKKRKATEEMSSRPSKRTSNIWHCCRCSHVESYHTSSSCQESDCQHQRCENCLIERVVLREDDDTVMMNQGAV